MQKIAFLLLLILFLFLLNRCAERWYIVEENEYIFNTSDSLIKKTVLI